MGPEVARKSLSCMNNTDQSQRVDFWDEVQKPQRTVDYGLGERGWEEKKVESGSGLEVICQANYAQSDNIRLEP